MVPLIVIGVVVALQWSQWRTGRPAAFPIALAPMEPHVVQPDRIWIDTDAACGAMGRIDPDDCFAIAWLVAQGVDISGVSTSFGNAPGHVVADRLAALFAQLDRDGLSPPPMFVGSRAWSRIDNPIPRADRYGNLVKDRGIFEMTAKKPRAELFSVMPKGDNIKPINIKKPT